MTGHCVTAFKFEKTKVYQKQIKNKAKMSTLKMLKSEKKILEWPETPC